MLKGKHLFDEVFASEESSVFWWLGQHSFIIRLGSATILIDPFLSEVEGRKVPPLFSPVDARGVDFVLCTHDHLDHIDPVAITGLAQETDVSFVAPRAHRNRILSLQVPAERLFDINDGETLDTQGLIIHGIKQAHERFDVTPDGLYPFLGYVIEGAGKTIYHSGDTVWWEGLQARLNQWVLDLMMIPINGRDARRLKDDVLGNMTYQEAADLSGGLRVGLTVPTHYDMFAFNSEDPQLFLDYMQVKYPDHACWAGEPTTKVTF